MNIHPGDRPPLYPQMLGTEGKETILGLVPILTLFSFSEMIASLGIPHLRSWVITDGPLHALLVLGPVLLEQIVGIGLSG